MLKSLNRNRSCQTHMFNTVDCEHLGLSTDLSRNSMLHPRYLETFWNAESALKLVQIHMDTCCNSACAKLDSQNELCHTCWSLKRSHTAKKLSQSLFHELGSVFRKRKEPSFPELSGSGNNQDCQWQVPLRHQAAGGFEIR